MTAQTAQTAQTALELRDVVASYGVFKALFGVSMTIPAGGAVALVGPNGSGKTTIARVASGLISPSAGAVLVDGADVTGSPTYEYARKGVAHAPEGRSVFATLTVEENLTLSIHRIRGRAGVNAGLDEAFTLFPRLGERRAQVAGTLSGGEQRMLAMARVLVDAPSVLIADELSLGLAPTIVDQTYRSLASFRAKGTALLVIEQHVSHALELCDQVVVLEHGAVSWAGPSDEAGSRVQAFLGAGAAH